MENAKEAIRRTLTQVKAFLAQEAPPRLNEADTRAFFIDPIVKALGWDGIGVVTREYHVRSSGEFIDYVGSGPGGRLLAIEAKPLQTELTDKHAAQLIQYCAVEGIEWAALTNGRELQFFNRYLKGDITEQRVLKLDLLAFDTDEEFDAIFGQVWQLSREGITAPSGTRQWLHQRRMDGWLRRQLLTADSHTVQHLRAAMAGDDIQATPQDVVEWFRVHLASGDRVPLRPAKSEASEATVRELTAGAAPTTAEMQHQAAGETRPAIGAPRRLPAGTGARSLGPAYFGVQLRELVDAGLLPPGTPLVLGTKRRDIATAVMNEAGAIVYEGRRYSKPSDKTFARLMGRQSLNGWTDWKAELPGGRVTLAELRDRLIRERSRRAG